MPEDAAAGRRRSASAVRVLWTLAAVVTVTAVATCAYSRLSGRTSGDRDRGNDGTTDGTAGRDGATADDTSRPEDAQTPAPATTVRWTAEDGAQTAVTAAVVRDDPTEEDRSADNDADGVDRADDDDDDLDEDEDVSHGPYPTTADGSVGVVHQNVYSTIEAAGRFPGDVRVAQSTAAGERHRSDHRGHHQHHHGHRPPARVEVEERPAHRTDWPTVAALAAAATLAAVKLAAVVGLLQLAFAVGLKPLLLVAAAASVKWPLLLLLLLLKLGKLFHALAAAAAAAAVAPLLLLPLAASLLNRAPASTDLQQSGTGGGGGGFSGSTFQTLPAVTGGGSTFQTLPGASSSSSSSMVPSRGRHETSRNAPRRCVEREACRAAAADGAPARIGRIPKGASKAISDEKINLYYKTYNDVRIEMYSTPSTSQENWELWCLKHYDCKDGNSTTTKLKNKK